MGISIQYISYSKKKDIIDGVYFSDFSEPESLDSFDLTIIDLRDLWMWRYDGIEASTVNCKQDLLNIRTMILNSRRTKFFVILPSNLQYRYKKQNGDYTRTCELKNKTEIITKLLVESLLPIPINSLPSILYENTRTQVGDLEVNASFHFYHSQKRLISASIGSNKITTFELTDRICITALQFEKTEIAVFFARTSCFPNKKEAVPEWMKSISFATDEEQHRIIKEKEAEIKQCQLQIAVAQAKLDKNDYYKSILYSTGDQLVEVVYDMLESMLECDLSEFVDVKNEDFLIKKESVTFIGEIKGIGSNVKSDNISQVDRHCASYSDELQDKGIHENLKEILIINPFRSKKLEDREPINDIQLRLAQRNECLIIKTEVLLRIFEAFLDGKISSQQIQECFASNSGELSICKALQSDM